MSTHEKVVQWLKIGLAVAFGCYFLWWSLQVLADYQVLMYPFGK